MLYEHSHTTREGRIKAAQCADTRSHEGHLDALLKERAVTRLPAAAPPSPRCWHHPRGLGAPSAKSHRS
jgi:hypothetical protein